MAESKAKEKDKPAELPSAKAPGIVADRQKRYGHPHRVYTVVGQLWSVYVAGRKHEVVKFEPADVANMMILLKEGREITTPGDSETIEDFAGYADVLEMIYQHEADHTRDKEKE